MKTMVYGIATCEHERWTECIETWQSSASMLHNSMIVKHKEVMEAYQWIYQATADNVIAYMHDDLEIYEKGWDLRVLREFDDPTVGIVGFGGATGHGGLDMYQKPFEISSMARHNFLSNQRTADRDGHRFTGERDVAVLDGFSLIVRRKVLDEAGGWPVGGVLGYFMYSEWMCCMARRLKYRIRLVGVDCQHLSGKSTGLNPNLRINFDGEHKAVYEEFRDVLPARVQ